MWPIIILMKWKQRESIKSLWFDSDVNKICCLDLYMLVNKKRTFNLHFSEFYIVLTSEADHVENNELCWEDF